MSTKMFITHLSNDGSEQSDVPEDVSCASR
jgi:hypothetical protein